MSAIADMLPLALAVLAVGAFAGVIAGLFGIGGGIIIVPALYHVFGALGASDATRMHAAVATSLATIIVTSLRSVSAHAKHGAVDGEVLRRWTPWIVAGALVGSLVARFVAGTTLSLVFGVGALLIAARMGLGGNGKPLAQELPKGAARAGIGGLIGFASSWMGIGGGVLGVMVMTLSGRPIHQAVGTAAGFGAAIGVPGALGFGIAGLGVAGRPDWSIGYVNLPGFALITMATLVTAPWGAALAHRLSKTLLRRLFAIGLALIALNMIWDRAATLLGSS